MVVLLFSMFSYYTANTFLFYFQVFLIGQPDYDSLDEQDLPAHWIPNSNGTVELKGPQRLDDLYSPQGS